MERDLELLRKILLTINESEMPIVHKFEIAGFDQQTVAEHVDMLVKGEYLDALVELYLDTSMEIKLIKRLTSKGHDLVALVQNEFNWNLVLKTFKKDNISPSFGQLIGALEDIDGFLYHKDQHKYLKRTTWATVVMAIATILLAIFSFFQWQILRNQSEGGLQKPPQTISQPKPVQQKTDSLRR